MSIPLLLLEKVSLSLGEKNVLRDFSMSLNEGEKIQIKGPSGSGKSTVLRMILGFQPPDQGKILYKGKPRDPGQVWQLRKETAYVPQKILLPPEPAGTLIRQPFTFKANLHLMPRDEDIRRWMDFFSLEPDTEQKLGDQLSGGEAQRISLIIALLLKRKIFFLDEATSALDRKLKEKTARLFLEQPGTLIVLSHDPVWDTLPGLRVITI